MPQFVSRREFLMTGSAVVVPGFVSAGEAGSRSAPQAPAAAAPATAGPNASFPAQDPAIVQEMVTVAHGNLARVKELVERWPTLAKASYDWGFGDWESALGAASHVGNRPIAEYLLAHGARPSIFSAAMLGQLDVVKAFVAASPGVQRIHGPHSLTLMSHAKAGGPASAAVVAYLESLGDADISTPSEPLTAEQMAVFTGDYSFGPGARDRIRIETTKGMGGGIFLNFQREGSSARRLVYRGEQAFSAVGAPDVRIRFVVEQERGMSLTVHDPDVVLTARRVG